MSPVFRFAVLLVGSAFVAAAGPSRGEEKKDDKPPAKWVPSVELGDKAGPTWLLKEAKVGSRMSSDRDYLIRDLPKEIIGGTYVMRPQDDVKFWLPNLAIKAKKDGTVYALIQTKYLGKDQFGEVAEALLEKDGWKEVEGKVATTFPAGERWEWKAYKKDLNKGDVILQLENLKWDNSAPVLFVFK